MVDCTLAALKAEGTPEALLPHRGYIGIMEKKMETTIVWGLGFRVYGLGLGFYKDKGNENGNNSVILGYMLGVR